jgi:hypothetical protein
MNGQMDEEEYIKQYKNLYCKCYLCGWEGINSQLIKVENVKGPMFGKNTTGYKCPNCKEICKYDGEDYT